MKNFTYKITKESQFMEPADESEIYIELDYKGATIVYVWDLCCGSEKYVEKLCSKMRGYKQFIKEMEEEGVYCIVYKKDETGLYID